MFTFLAAKNFCSGADVTVPSLGAESKIFGLNWQMKRMINWGVAIDVTSENLRNLQ